MKVLMLGGAGFIGSHLTKELIDHGHDVVVCDRQAMLVPDERATLRPVTNLLLPGSVKQVIKEERYDIVIHLAAQVGRLFGEDDLRHTVESNALLSSLVASTCAETKTRLLYISTSEVYGDQGEHLLHESDECAVPHNLYGLSKFWGEQVAAMYLSEKSPFQVIRLSMPFGPGMVPGRGRAAIVNMLWQANTGQKIPVHRGSERAWCWVGDTVAGMRMVIEEGEAALSSGEWQCGIGVYNVGRSDNAISMIEVARMACEISGASTDLIEEVDPPSMQTVVKRLSNERLRSIGWSPVVDVREGMEVVFQHVRNFDAEGNLTEAGSEKSQAIAANVVHYP